MSKHKKIYRARLTIIAICSGDAKKEGEALVILTRGSDLSLRLPPKAKPTINSTILHHSLRAPFQQGSDQQTLGLTEDSAGPKVPPPKKKIELSGTPTLLEVQSAIKGLNRGTAPGSMAFGQNSSSWVTKRSLGA